MTAKVAAKTPSCALSSRQKQSDPSQPPWRTPRRVLSRIAAGLGPSIPHSLIRSLQNEKITNLNLHANDIRSLDILMADNCARVCGEPPLGSFVLDDLRELDLSSNSLGSRNTTSKTNGSNEPNLLCLCSNLQTLNLAANNLTTPAAVISTLLHAFSLSLKHLAQLNLSRNGLTEIPTNLFGSLCPNLKSLNLTNNSIRALHPLLRSLYPIRQSLCTLTLQCNNEKNAKSNPVCISAKYRPALICALLNLTNLDDMDVSENERTEARMKLDLGFVVESDNQTEEKVDHALGREFAAKNKKVTSGKPQPSCRLSQCSRHVLSQDQTPHELASKKVTRKFDKVLSKIKEESNLVHLGQDNEHPSESENACLYNNFKHPRIITAQRRKTDAGGDLAQKLATKISAEKLNALEQSVRLLSEVAGQQAEATQHILDMQNFGNRQNADDSRLRDTIGNDEKLKHGHKHAVDLTRKHNQCVALPRTTMVSDVEVQTHFVDLDPPLELRRAGLISREAHNKAVQTLVLQIALLKWETYSARNKQAEKNIACKNHLAKDVKEGVAMKRLCDCGPMAEAFNSKHDHTDANKTILTLQEQLATTLQDHYTLKSKYENDMKRIGLKAEEELQASIKSYKTEEQKRLQFERERTEMSVSRMDLEYRDTIEALTRKAEKATLESENALRQLYEEKRLSQTVKDKYRNLLKRENVAIKEANDIASKTCQERVRQAECIAEEKITRLKAALETVMKRAALDKVVNEKTAATGNDAALLIKSQRDDLTLLRQELLHSKGKIYQLQLNESVMKGNASRLENLANELREQHHVLIRAADEKNLRISELVGEKGHLKESISEKEISLCRVKGEVLDLQLQGDEMKSNSKEQQKYINKLAATIDEMKVKLNVLHSEQGKYEQAESDLKLLRSSLYQAQEQSNQLSTESERQVKLLKEKAQEQEAQLRSSSDAAFYEHKANEEKGMSLITKHQTEIKSLQECHSQQVHSLEEVVFSLRRDKEKLARKKCRAEADAKALALQLHSEVCAKSQLEIKIKELESKLSQQISRTQAAFKGLSKELILLNSVPTEE